MDQSDQNLKCLELKRKSNNILVHSPFGKRPSMDQNRPGMDQNYSIGGILMKISTIPSSSRTCLTAVRLVSGSQQSVIMNLFQDPTNLLLSPFSLWIPVPLLAGFPFSFFFPFYFLLFTYYLENLCQK